MLSGVVASVYADNEIRLRPNRYRDQREHRGLPRVRKRREVGRNAASAIVYCTRSFVPIDRKSTWSRIRSVNSAAGRLDHHAAREFVRRRLRGKVFRFLGGGNHRAITHGRV